MWTDAVPRGPSKVFFTSRHSACGPKWTHVASRIAKQYPMAATDLRNEGFRKLLGSNDSDRRKLTATGCR